MDENLENNKKQAKKSSNGSQIKDWQPEEASLKNGSKKETKTPKPKTSSAKDNIIKDVKEKKA